jgi:hypothetical protein
MAPLSQKHKKERQTSKAVYQIIIQCQRLDLLLSGNLETVEYEELLGLLDS